MLDMQRPAGVGRCLICQACQRVEPDGSYFNQIALFADFLACSWVISCEGQVTLRLVSNHINCMNRAGMIDNATIAAYNSDSKHRIARAGLPDA
jgi:hypothetical protein